MGMSVLIFNGAQFPPSAPNHRTALQRESPVRLRNPAAPRSWQGADAWADSPSNLPGILECPSP